MKKTISALLTVTILLFSVSSVFAAIDIIEDSGYAIVDPTTVPGASVYENLVPNVSVTPTPMTSKEELKSYTSNLFSNQFGNYDFYKIDVTVSNLGELVNGKDENENSVYVGIYDIKVFLPGVTSFPRMNWKNDQISGNTMNFVANTAGTGMNFKWTAPSLSNPYPLFNSSADPFVSQYIADASLSWYVVVGIETGSTLTISDIDTTITYTHSIDKKNPENNNAAKQSVTLAPAAPTKYTVTFKNADGTANIQSNEYDANATVTAPGVANKAGYTFTGWSESVGGATVTPIATATADKTYYAVFAKDAGVTDPAEDAIANNIGVTGLKDINGEDVPALTKNYGITKFSTILDSAYDYYLIVEDEEGNIKDENSANPFKIDFDAEHIETSGTVSFFALVHSTTHVIKSIVLKAVAK